WQAPASEAPPRPHSGVLQGCPGERAQGRQGRPLQAHRASPSPRASRGPGTRCPASDVGPEPCRCRQAPRPGRKEMRGLDKAEIERLLETARRSRYYIPILLAIAPGMRRGEMLALRWEDGDVEGGRISVRRTLGKTGDGLQFTDPKTDRSRRVIRIGPLVVQALRRHRAQQAQEKLRLGPAYQDRGLVCAQANGKPYDPAEFSKAFTSLAKRAGFPDLRFHDLRHSHATLLLRDGTPIKAVAERLGHASAAFTLDTYGHSLPDMQEAAARVVDALLSAPAENQ